MPFLSEARGPRKRFSLAAGGVQEGVHSSDDAADDGANAEDLGQVDPDFSPLGVTVIGRFAEGILAGDGLISVGGITELGRVSGGQRCESSRGEAGFSGLLSNGNGVAGEAKSDGGSCSNGCVTELARGNLLLSTSQAGVLSKGLASLAINDVVVDRANN